MANPNKDPPLFQYGAIQNTEGMGGWVKKHKNLGDNEIVDSNDERPMLGPTLGEEYEGRENAEVVVRVTLLTRRFTRHASCDSNDGEIDKLC